jgi:hypothetical protein
MRWCEDVDSVHLAEEEGQWWAFLIAVVNVQVP